MKKRQYAAALTAISMLFNSASVFADEDDLITSVFEENNSDENTTEENTAEDYEIMGIFLSFDSRTGTIQGYKGSPESIVIPDTINGVPVTCIGNKAFEDCDSLTDIIITDNVISIGEDAFSGCTNLKSAKLPAHLSSVAEGTFRKCSSLESITIPEGVTSIGASAFAECYVLSKADLPESLTTIENSAFWNDSKLYDITLPQNLKYIGGGAFYYCFCSNADMPSDYELVIPDSVNYIGEYAFQGCQGVCHLKLPSGLTKINMGTFYFMNSLREIDIPDGVKTIGFDAFCDCKALSEVKLPAKLEVIGERAFGLCTSLFEVKIPSGVTTINDYAFARSNPGLSNKSLSNLTAVHIPASVTNMGDVFYNDNFDKLVLFVEKDSDAEKYAKTNGIKYSNGDFVPYTTGSNTIYFDTGNGEIICTDGSRFTDYDIPSQIEGVDVVSIAAQAFEGQYYLKNVTIPDGVTEIGKQAFNNCLRLESIVIPNTVTQIGENAFSGILDKDSFVLYVHPDSYAEHYAKDNGFNYEYISEDNNISYAVENGSIYIDENGVIVSADEGITAAEIPTQIGDLNITAIGENAFSNCKALLSINIPESITAISPSAFAGCDESLVLYMPQNSYAAQFAKDNNLKYAYTDVTFVFGDADADNVVTASDAAFVLQKTLISTFELPIQKKTDDWLKYVDVDADTNITASDAAFILQKTLISTFELPAEKKYK